MKKEEFINITFFTFFACIITAGLFVISIATVNYFKENEKLKDKNDFIIENNTGVVVDKYLENSKITRHGIYKPNIRFYLTIKGVKETKNIEVGKIHYMRYDIGDSIVLFHLQ